MRNGPRDISSSRLTNANQSVRRADSVSLWRRNSTKVRPLDVMSGVMAGHHWPAFHAISDCGVVPYHTLPDMTRPDRAIVPLAGLVTGILVLAWPQLSGWIPGTATAYPLVTALFTVLVVTIVVTWPRHEPAQVAGIAVTTPFSFVVALTAAAIVAGAAYRWTRLLAWQPYQADMLIVVREATRRFISGRTPYTTYRTYDAPWNIAMPYGPALWAPYLIPQLLRLDFRFLTIVGELFVPLWCGGAAIVESTRGRVGSASWWLAILFALVLTFDVQGFTLIGHTPVYWPLLPVFAVLIWRSRWLHAAFILGLLVLARTTMVAIVPVFLMAAWTGERRRFPAVLMTLTVTIGVVLVPFIAWAPREIWDNMVLSYPRVMREAVWPVLARSGIETIGTTEWLLERHLEILVVPAQLLAMAGVYAAAWLAIRRGAAPLAWMALALFAFSMTSLYPVHYLYYDVLLLLVCGAIAATLEPVRASRLAALWLLSAVTLVALMAGMARGLLAPFPLVSVGEESSTMMLRSGFAMAESDGQQMFSWVVGHDATIVLPRRSAQAAIINMRIQSAIENPDAPQSMTAILNGTVIGHATIRAGWQEIGFAAPPSTWWVGFNQLHLLFSSTMVPRLVGAGDDPRELAAAVSGVAVVPQKPQSALH